MTFKWTDDPNKTVTLTEDRILMYTNLSICGRPGAVVMLLTYDYLPHARGRV